jgi:AcrR family transcriptional regulator
MRPERFARLDTESRRRLLDVAMREFATRGFERASLNEIIAEAGLSKGSYYYYFHDKRALLLETLRVAFETVREIVPMAKAPKTREAFWPELEAHNLRIVEVVSKQPLVLALLASLHRTHLADPFFEPLRSEMRDMYLPSLRAGQKLGCVRTDMPLPALAHIWEAADSAFDEAFAGKPITPARIASHASLAFDLFKRVFEAREPAPRRASPEKSPRRQRPR